MSINGYRTPEKNQNGFIFSLYQTENHTPNPEILYGNLASIFAKTLDRIGMGLREDGNENRRQITFHSFRRWVKTTIQNGLLAILVLHIGEKKIMKKQKFSRRLNLT